MLRGETKRYIGTNLRPAALRAADRDVGVTAVPVTE